MKSPRSKIPFGVFAVIVALLIAQSEVLAHLDLNDAHPTEESCALCVGLSTLSAGNVFAVDVLDTAFRVTLPVSLSDTGFAEIFHDLNHARGPPQAF